MNWKQKEVRDTSEKAVAVIRESEVKDPAALGLGDNNIADI